MRIVLDLEDTFGDIVRKASRGTGVTVGALAMRTGIAAERLQQFLSDAGPPTEDEARAIAAELKLDGGKLPSRIASRSASVIASVVEPCCGTSSRYCRMLLPRRPGSGIGGTSNGCTAMR